MSQLALAERLNFIGLDKSARDDISRVKQVLSEVLPGALDHFYVRLKDEPKVSHFFQSDGDVSRAHGAQVRHWARIASGEYDDDYAKSVQKIGETHARIGLEPRWYIAGYALIIERLILDLLKRGERTGIIFSKTESENNARSLAAIVKAALLDMDIAISVYLETAERERRRLEEEQQRTAAQQAKVVKELATALSKLASGDLVSRVNEVFSSEYESLRGDFNEAVAALAAAMREIGSNTEAIHAGAGEIAKAVDDLARRTEHQAATLEETAAAVEEITSTVRKTAEGACQANVAVQDARTCADEGAVIVQDAVMAMHEIEHSSNKITQIIGVIDEIAFQTNLLALNAGVEAARAGDSGRGFAVVAAEVRALAQRSSSAAKEIKSLIAQSSDQVEAGVALVTRSGAALKDISANVNAVAALIGEISASAQEQSTALGEVNVAVAQMDQTTQQNAAMVEETNSACHGLTDEAAALAGLVQRFRVAETLMVQRNSSLGTTPAFNAA